MRIRTAREDDLVSIHGIYNQAIRKGFATAHLTEQDMDDTRRWFSGHDPQRYPVSVCEEEGTILGWVSISPYRAGRQALDHVAEVSYYVHLGHLRRCIGSRLLTYATEQAPGLGITVLVAILLGKNQASIGLLEKLGFARWGTMPGIARIGHEEVDHVYYGRKL